MPAMTARKHSRNRDALPSRAMAHARTAPWLLAAVLAVAWLLIGPATPDLAAAVYRAGLFQREGFTLFNANWYGGHHTPAYSILFPPLGALVGVRLVGALAAVASAVLFERIARRHFGDDRARWGALWFGAGTVADLLIGRLTFALGVTLGLAAIFMLQRGHRRSGLAFGAACTLASPVAGLFLALAGVAHWLSRQRRERIGLALAAVALAPAVVLSILFPEGGSQPFRTTTFVAIVLSCILLLWLIPRQERTLRAGALVYLASALLAFVVASPMGDNASRLGVAFAGPLLLCAALAPGTDGRRRQRVLGAALVLLVWQWWAPVRETIKGAVDPSAQAAYFKPLVSFVDARAEGTVRVEVPFTRLHWESVYIARTIPLARGWVTQLDRKYNALFRPGDHGLTAARYRAWLDREGVRYVGLPDVALDPSGRGEARLIRGGLPFLQRVYRDRHWQIFEVLGTPGLADGVGSISRLRPQSFELRAHRPGFTLVRIRYTPYWRVAGGLGCVLRAGGGWTLVYALRAGPLRVETSFDPRRVLDGDDARCSQRAAPTGPQT
ncbi:MAG: hypothetical protein QOD24_3429 [Solirubrobacteraceae bacterium]|nr:hypothetical protein [Solirubrobacteraceae bacterium]